MKKHIPNIITIIRLALAISFPIIFFFGNKQVALTIYIVAALSDSIDGFLARRWNVVSKLGAKLDVVADKFLALIGLLTLVIEVNNNALYLIIGEVLIIAAVTYRELKKEPQQTAIIGKVKTVFLFTTISLMLVDKYISNVSIALNGLLIITVIQQIITAYVYLTRKKEKNEK